MPIEKEGLPRKQEPIRKSQPFTLDTIGDIFVDFVGNELPRENLSKRQRIKKKFYYIKDHIVPKKMTEIISSVIASKLKIEGKENLDETYRITKGKQIIFILNHLSNIDTFIFRHALTKAKHEEMRENTIFLQGIKLDRNPAAKLFLKAVPRIKVWPPSLVPKNNKEIKKRRAMNKESLVFSRKALQKGRNLAIYAEGGRSYDSKLKKVESAIAHYIDLSPDAIVVPVSISGTEHIMPRRKLIPQPYPAIIVFGKPIEAKSLKEMFIHLSNNERREKTMNFIMGKLAQNLPENYRGAYSGKS